jgi:hypothetical protein
MTAAPEIAEKIRRARNGKYHRHRAGEFYGLL